MAHIKTFSGTYENLKNIETSQDAGYTIGYLSDCFYFKEAYEIIVIDLSKQQTFDTGPKEIKGINFTRNPDSTGYDTNFFVLTESKEVTLDFPNSTIKVLQ